MKVSLYLLLIWLMACKPADPTATHQLFYNTWERQMGTYQGKDGDYFGEKLITFQANGEVLYGEQLSPGGCCRPTQFALTNYTLQFTGRACPFVRCNSHELNSAGPWQIVTLTPTTLIIRKADQQISYQAR